MADIVRPISRVARGSATAGAPERTIPLRAPHTATAEDGSFDSGRLDQGASFEYTFNEPGTFAYRCNIQPGMIGSIVVT